MKIPALAVAVALALSAGSALAQSGEAWSNSGSWSASGFGLSVKTGLRRECSRILHGIQTALGDEQLSESVGTYDTLRQILDRTDAGIRIKLLEGAYYAEDCPAEAMVDMLLSEDQ